MNDVVARFGSWVMAVLLGGAVAGLLVLGFACSGEPERKGGPVTRITEPEDAIDEALMLSLSQAKNFHHKARVYMSDGQLPLATDAVRKILAIELPAGAPEAEDVRLDARAMLAKLLVAQGQVDAAMSVVDEGLASSTRESFFVANLYTVKGEVLQAQAELLVSTGEPGDAERAREVRKQAIVAFDKSIAINEALQKRILGEK
jgi:predicted negative regulator of RcsB-dependent stress response